MPFHISQPSHQSLYIEITFDQQKISNGTGFLARSTSGKCFLLTNRHIVTGRHQETGKPMSSTGAIPNTLFVWHNQAGQLGIFTRIRVPLYKDDVPLWIEHPGYQGQVDCVALTVEITDDIDVYPYSIDKNTHLNIEPSQRICVIGFPFGERTGASFAIWATGFIASEPEINHNGKPIFLIDCRSRKGQSGSPVITYQDIDKKDSAEDKKAIQLLGIYSGRINEDSDLGIVWKSYVLVELIEYASTL